MYRVLRPHGRLVMSDPICEQDMNETLREDEKLRALCLSGSIPLKDYIKLLTDVGFGTIEVRAKRPYRFTFSRALSDGRTYFYRKCRGLRNQGPMPKDGPCVFTGKTAIYFGNEEFFDDKNGHVLLQNQPLAVCDKTAANLAQLNRNDLFITGSTYHYDGGGCC